MNPTIVAHTIFAGLFLSALLGMRLRSRLPDHHLSSETKEAVRIGMGSVATMAALVLGLLVASTKSAYDTEKNEVQQISAKVIYLDRVLQNFGPDTAECRRLLRDSVQSAISRLWPDTAKAHSASSTTPSDIWSRSLPLAVQNLNAQTDAQKTFKSQAAQLCSDLAQMRWLLYEQTESSVSAPLLLIMVFWLALTFISVGLFAPLNSVVVAAQLLAALSVAGAIFLILELDKPFGGLVQISPKPMLNALSNLMQEVG